MDSSVIDLNNRFHTDYTNPDSLRLLASKIQMLSDRQKIYFAAFVMDNELMKPKGFSAWLVWSLINAASKKRKMDRTVFYIVLCDKYKKHGLAMAIDTLNQTCDWLVNGKDTTCNKSAGGFNSEEIRKLEDIVIGVSMVV
jgi:hypothetical protein